MQSAKLPRHNGCSTRLMVDLMRLTLRRASLMLLLAGPVVAAAQSPKHYVFAHYMTCYADYGNTVDGFMLDIMAAQSAGIDGFALDIGEWDGPDWYYKAHVGELYAAAEQLGTGFKLFPFLEFFQPDQVIEMITNYANSPASFWYQGKVVLSSWGGNSVTAFNQVGVDWTNAIFAPLQQLGYPVFFVPHFWPNSGSETPTYSDAVQILATNGPILNGLFLFGAAGVPSVLAQCNSNYTLALHAAGKLFMAGLTPHYWGCGQLSNGQRYYESDGGEGIALQWNSIIANQPDWVNLVTWNDFNESTYITPLDNPAAYWQPLASPNRYSHDGYCQLSKYFITWYKTGTPPPVTQDALFYFYRTHPLNAVASTTNIAPVTTFFGDVGDVIYTTTLLTAPALLEITSGNNSTTNFVPPGLCHTRTPFAPGPQQFTLVRGTRQVLTTQGPNIQSQIAVYDFFPASGCAYAPAPGAPAAPTGLQTQ